MDKYDIIFKKYQTHNDDVISELENITFSKLLKNTNFKIKDNIKLLYYYGLKNYSPSSIMFKKLPSYFEKYVRILESYGYRVESGVRHAIEELGLLENPCNNSDMIKLLLNYPDILDISFNDKDTFNIYSEMYGKIPFKLASEVFKNNIILSKYIKNTPLSHNCHNHTYFMSKIFPDNYSITSLVNQTFEGMRYYHSYGYNKLEGNVIDLNMNAIINNDIFDKLYQPEIIVYLKNTEVDSVLNEVNEITNQKDERHEMLKIALYMQSLEEENKVLIKK